VRGPVLGVFCPIAVLSGAKLESTNTPQLRKVREHKLQRCLSGGASIYVCTTGHFKAAGSLAEFFDVRQRSVTRELFIIPEKQ
jgi:hypothetical protein